MYNVIGNIDHIQFKTYVSRYPLLRQVTGASEITRRIYTRMAHVDAVCQCLFKKIGEYRKCYNLIVNWTLNFTFQANERFFSVDATQCYYGMSFILARSSLLARWYRHLDHHCQSKAKIPWPVFCKHGRIAVCVRVSPPYPVPPRLKLEVFTVLCWKHQTHLRIPPATATTQRPQAQSLERLRRWFVAPRCRNNLSYAVVRKRLFHLHSRADVAAITAENRGQVSTTGTASAGINLPPTA